MNEAQKYINVTVAQLFYTSNLVHDLYYRSVGSAQIPLLLYWPDIVGMDLTNLQAISNNTTLAPRMMQLLLTLRMVPDSTTPTSWLRLMGRMGAWGCTSRIPPFHTMMATAATLKLVLSYTNWVSHGLSTHLTGGPENWGWKRSYGWRMGRFVGYNYS